MKPLLVAAALMTLPILAVVLVVQRVARLIEQIERHIGPGPAE